MEKFIFIFGVAALVATVFSGLVLLAAMFRNRVLWYKEIEGMVMTHNNEIHQLKKQLNQLRQETSGEDDRLSVRLMNQAVGFNNRLMKLEEAADARKTKRLVKKVEAQLTQKTRKVR